MKHLLLLFILLVIGQFCLGQGFDRPRSGVGQQQQEDGDEGPLDAELFQQVSINLSNSTPRINIKALKLYAEFGEKTFLDFYILSSVPTIETDPSDSIKNLGNELQNLYGGLLNGYFSKTWYLNKKSDFQTRGFQLDLKAGYKLTNSSKNSGTESLYLSSGQAIGEARFLIPLRKGITDENLAGLAQLKVSGQALYTDNSGYNNYFTLENGEEPSKFLLSLAFEASVHVFNQFYISAGGSFSSIDSMENMSYFKVSYSKPN